MLIVIFLTMCMAQSITLVSCNNNNNNKKYNNIFNRVLVVFIVYTTPLVLLEITRRFFQLNSHLSLKTRRETFQPPLQWI